MQPLPSLTDGVRCKGLDEGKTAHAEPADGVRGEGFDEEKTALAEPD